MADKPRGRFRPGVPMTPDPRSVGGFREQTTAARDAKAYLGAARIVHVDTETMVCSLRLDSGFGEFHDVPIPAPGGGGPRSWSGSVPERGTKVIIGWKREAQGNRAFKPYIVEFMTAGIYLARDYEPFSTVDPADAQTALNTIPAIADDPGVNLDIVRLKNRKVYAGDYVASSSSGADALLDRDALLTNRAGNEFRIRDADQTAVLQVLNEFTSNAAGYYRRGLIKRNAYSFLPDLFPADENGKVPDTISKDSPAYPLLLQFGLITEDGKKNFPDNPDEPFYPHVVTPDGQHIAYVVHGEHDLDFANTSLAYVEDRKELRHLSDGVMAVTEEGDGFQIDPPYPVFIEDAMGTVVGNDFHSDGGRPLYKRPLKMSVFKNLEQGAPSDAPVFEAVDTIQDLSIMDDIGLARLFRVVSPNGSNQFAFGVSKEGRVFVHVPKSRVGTPDMKGKSIDLNVQGLIKAIIGSDSNSRGTSMDLRLTGGLNLDIGRNEAGNSIEVTLHGGILQRITNNPASNAPAFQQQVGGSSMRTISATDMAIVGGNMVEEVGGDKSTVATSVLTNAGQGGYKVTSAGDWGMTILGKTQHQYAQMMQSTWALGKQQMILAGVDTKTHLAGAVSHTLVAGAMSTTVVTGAYSVTAAAGSMSLTVGAGTLSATVGAGSLSLTCGGGPVSITSGLINSITAATMNQLTAPFNKIGASVAGFCMAGIPGPPGPMIDYLLGIPHLGVPTIIIG